MRILLIGGGGREHALAWKLLQSPQVSQLFAAPGSDALAAMGVQCQNLENHPAVGDFALAQQIDLVVVGPEAPLVAGLADHLRARGIPVFGPSAQAAQLEGSKAFAKGFMARHGIPTAAYGVFEQEAPALAWIDAHPGPCVVKADGLAAGKGVVVCADSASARQAVGDLLGKQVLGQAGQRVVIEAFLPGQEASYFVITDGKAYVALPACQDHKRVFDLDQGPNTGGMGAYAPAPLVTPEVEARVRREIVEPTLAGMAAEGHPYQGVLYVGLMIDQGAPQVVEFNCRFGDPECQALMLLLDNDLAALLLAAVESRLEQIPPRIKPGHAACIVMAAQGYPGDPVKGMTIRGLDTAPQEENCQVFHAGTRRDAQGRWLVNGGRVLGITVWGQSLAQALTQGYRVAQGIDWPGHHYRKDIGMKALKTRDPARPATNVAIVVGSASDLDVAQKASEVLKKLDIGHEMAVASAHRTPERVRAFLQAAEAAGAEVVIAMAGMAAALPGVVAAETLLPVIGVPLASTHLDGLDALLSIAQMPPGIPVATVAVGGAANAALLAAHILALKYPDVRAALAEYRLEQAAKVAEAHRAAGLSVLV